MYRLFAALPVPSGISTPLRKLQKDLPGASWRPEENFHVTLCFYGALSDNQARDLDELLGEIDADAFDLKVEGMGWFGRREPTAVWARIGDTDGLRALASQCERAARRLGIGLEKHPFTPHITLAYLHGTPLDAARDWTHLHQSHRSEPFRASLFHLYASHARRGGGPSRYEAMADYPLRDLTAGFD